MRTPYILWVIINWAGVAVHAGLTIGVTYLNFKLLPGPIKPKMWIVVANIAWSIILFVYFAAWTIYEQCDDKAVIAMAAARTTRRSL